MNSNETVKNEFEKKFEEYKKKGESKYNLLKDAKPLKDQTKKDRLDFFNTEYETKLYGRRQEDNPYAPYNYISIKKGSPYAQNSQQNKEGHYINEIDLAQNTIVAHQNYIAGEEYFDSEKKQKVRYSNSEILYQQWTKAKMSLPKKGEGSQLADSKLVTLRRAHIAGDAIEVVKNVKEWLTKKGNNYNPTKDITFDSTHPVFYALLAAANCQAAIFLIIDHGDDLGIKNIKEINLMAGESIEIKFQ